MIKYNGYSAECDTLDELVLAVKRLPQTIKFVSLNLTFDPFHPERVKLEWSENLSSLIEVIIDEAWFEQGNIDIQKFSLLSYYGEGKEDHAYYIKLDTERSVAFGEAMGSGQGGSLD
tara:strand:- start:714 stop:1064 length:351 start_codon:yes stop_codon:yes gene_type:complete